VIDARIRHHRTSAVNRAVLDGLLALLVTSLALASLVGSAAHLQLTQAAVTRLHTADALGVALLVLGTLSIGRRRDVPVLVLGVAAMAFLGYDALGHAPPLLPFAPAIALYTIAVTRTPLAAVSATTVTTVVAAYAAHRDLLTREQFLVDVLSMVAATLLGYGVQLHGRMASLKQQAVQLVREHTDETRLAVEQEQARIARELHDIVAHSVSLIIAQASVARRTTDTELEQARQVLGSIERTGREALTEMRGLLGVLQPGRDRPEPESHLGLDRLPALITQVQQTGLPVQLLVHGNPRPLPSEIELTVYRIVQEALTNTLKHAGVARATVVLSHHPGTLELRIWDDGHGGASTSAPGNGLAGMQQRAALLGGELTAGPRPGGGFQVVATLPLEDRQRCPSPS
jgi:signal transduction histidine kinase